MERSGTILSLTAHCQVAVISADGRFDWPSTLGNWKRSAGSYETNCFKTNASWCLYSISFETGVVPEYQCAVKREAKKAQKEKDRPNPTSLGSPEMKDAEVKVIHQLNVSLRFNSFSLCDTSHPQTPLYSHTLWMILNHWLNDHQLNDIELGGNWRFFSFLTATAHRREAGYHLIE